MCGLAERPPGVLEGKRALNARLQNTLRLSVPRVGLAGCRPQNPVQMFCLTEEPKQDRWLGPPLNGGKPDGQRPPQVTPRRNLVSKCGEMPDGWDAGSSDPPRRKPALSEDSHCAPHKTAWRALGAAAARLPSRCRHFFRLLTRDSQ